MTDLLENIAASLPPTCEQCGQAFEPRKGSGGKPQRFCRPDCRQAFHADGQRSQRGPTFSAPMDARVLISGIEYYALFGRS
jgi:hypothetical protein